MTQVMTPSVNAITSGQIDKSVGLYRALLEKHRSALSSEATQRVLGQPDFVAEMYAVLSKRVEAVSNMITRRVTVDRTPSLQAMLNDLGRTQYVDGDVVKTMPRGEGDEAEVVFFKLNRWISDDDLEKEYELRGCKPTDPYSLAAVNKADPAFADEHPNATHWKDANGKWCYAAFNRWYDERGVSVDRHRSKWNDYWWFAGVSK